MTLLLHPMEGTNQKKICWNCEHLTVETMIGTGCGLRFLFSHSTQGTNQITTCWDFVHFISGNQN